jgi:hypothetical protein
MASIDPSYREAASNARRLAGSEGIDALVARYRLDAIVAPTRSPAWTSDTVLGNYLLGSASKLAAVAGYPHITVPMGFVRGLPVGLSIFACLVRRKADRYRLCVRAARLCAPGAGLPANPTGMRNPFDIAAFNRETMASQG